MGLSVPLLETWILHLSWRASSCLWVEICSGPPLYSPSAPASASNSMLGAPNSEVHVRKASCPSLCSSHRPEEEAV
jgi:hypothetical protein